MSNYEPQFAEAIKEFNARLGDELSIKPGEIIEVIADDREFNDGWYMGKNLSTNGAGLYPKSFTKPAPNPHQMNNAPDLHHKSSNDSTLLRSRSRSRQSLTSPLGSPIGSPMNNQNQVFTNQNQNQSARSSVSSRVSSPTNNKYNSMNSIQNNINGLINNNGNRSSSGTNINGKFDTLDESAENNLQNSGNVHRGSHSSVIKTMSDIDQALEEFNPNGYIEEEHNNNNVMVGNFGSRPIPQWDSQDVCDYFSSLNYRTEALQFQRHKITGSILLELELAYLKELDIGPFGTRFEIFKIIENLRNKVNSGNTILNPASNNNNNIDNKIVTPKQKRVSGTGIMVSGTKQTYQKPHQGLNSSPVKIQKQQSLQNPVSPSFSQAPPPAVNDYLADSYTMDNPYLNSSTDNLSANPSSNNYDHETYSSSSNSELMPAMNAIETAPSTATPGSQPSSQQRVLKGNGSQSNYPLSSSIPKNSSAVQPQYEERQFSPIRKAPLPPGSTQSPKKNNDLYSGTTGSVPSTPSANSGNNNGNRFNKMGHIPFSAGSRVPDSPTFNGEGEMQKLNLEDQPNIQQPVQSPKYRSASANDTINKSPQEVNHNNANTPKRSVSSAVPTNTSVGLESSAGNGESSFKVTQVRNAQTSKVIKKTKKQTSAFQEGINHITPEISSKNAEFSGWMSKKSSSAVGPWKQRFFTLHGTRLSYFGSMKDIKEKGLIDITAHRVLPAREDDKLVSLYAATTGQGRFCFKLVPPGPGSKKGLTFTQPKVHYFAVETREEMRNWMSALMKATIDLDDTVPTVSTCSTPTVSLQKAQELLLKARENARNRDEKLRAKGFVQPGINPNASNNISQPQSPLDPRLMENGLLIGSPISEGASPNLEMLANNNDYITNGFDGNINTIPSSSSSTNNSGLASNHSNSNHSNNTNINDYQISSPKSDDTRKTFASRFKNL